MRLILALFIVSICLAACGGETATPEKTGRSVSIELDRVVFRQYHDGQMRFEMRAGSLEIDEDGHKLVASDGVSGRLQPDMWEERE